MALVFPVRAQAARDVDATVTVLAGELSIAVPTSVNLGLAVPGTDLVALLGAVTVTDERSQLSAVWVATVTASDFTTGDADPSETIPAETVEYWSGPATETTGTGNFVPGQLTSADAVPLDEAREAFGKSSGDRDNSVVWSPTLIIHIPIEALAGTYTGTITHSVA
ncbi:hypothetical protein AB0J90_18815 [Micromonospora sp. NPDC049523]|uniref:hypothetical protein n=1 Tax=Micromonospora sp. NPDC049523 TaxID=3155921 RepID=UPI003419CBF3